MTTQNSPVTPPTPSGTTPLWLLFALGAVMIVPVGLTSLVTVPLAAGMSSPLAQLFTVAFVGSSLPEELLRFVVRYYIGLRAIGISRPRDGLVFGLLVSLGFSCAENVYYAISIGWATGLLKLTIATPIHLALGITMGCLMAVATSAPERRRPYLCLAFAIPVLLHGAYDLVLLRALADGTASDGARLALPAICYMLVIVVAVLSMLRAGRSRAVPTQGTV